MILVVAEKPAVARAIAPVLGATKKMDGYSEGNGYYVSWCYGHLVGLLYPDEITEKWAGKWELSQLPMMPDTWRFKVQPGAAEQFAVLKRLMLSDQVDTVVCATDADREGECIFRYVYNLAGCRKPVERLWVSSLEESAIRDGFRSLKPGSEYDSLFKAGFCRAKADWLLGMNGSRLFSILYNAHLNTGRVQTPTLAMVVKRDGEVAGFVQTKTYTVDLALPGMTASSRKFDSPEEAGKLREKCTGATATVTDFRREKKTENPPKLFDLTTLQREANKAYGYTAQQTLDALQSLYEAKLATYPRTDSQYLSDDMEDTARAVTRAAFTVFPGLGSCPAEPDTGRCIDNSKVGGHHAILPTENILKADLSRLKKEEYDILMLVCARLAMATGIPHRYEAEKCTITCSGEEFTATGRRIVEPGWKLTQKAIRNMKKQGDDEEAGEDPSGTSSLPEAVPGQTFPVTGAEVAEHLSAPPKPYTEDTLLSAMEHAGAEAYDDGTEKKGLGTPATRAATIEGLIQHGYVERSGKKVVSTAKGRSLIAVVPEEVKSPQLTAEWENRLRLVEEGKYAAPEFMSGIESYVRGICAKYTAPTEGMSFHSADAYGSCPKCGRDIIKGKNGPYCTGRCGILPGKVYGKELTESQLKKLLSGKTVKITTDAASGRETTVLPEVIPHEWNGKTYYQWKTESTGDRKGGAQAKGRKPSGKGGRTARGKA